jgi:acyl-CoA hydrolase
VRTGSASVTVDGTPVTAHLDADNLRFTAPAPSGASVSVTSVNDGCGNTGP